MSNLMRYTGPEASFWSPLEKLSNLRQEMDRLWDITSRSSGSLLGGWSPAVDLYDCDEQLVAKIELPGLKQQDFEINYQEGVLTISGERKGDFPEGKEPETYRQERAIGKFQRNIALPSPIEMNKIQASYKDGVLTVNMPKSEEAKPHRVEVAVAG